MALKQSPFEGWAITKRYNTSGGVDPASFTRCWHAALCRLSIALNHQALPRRYPRRLLAESDEVVLRHFQKQKLKPPAYSILYETIAPALSQEALDKADIATNFFYGTFEYLKESTGGANPRTWLRIKYRLTQVFLDYCYDGLHRPTNYDGSSFSYTDLGAVRANWAFINRRCATNYILRNFWHNVCHDICQNITNTNFDDFRGRARYDSDFEADNLSLIFLVYSYGIPVISDDTSNKVKDDRVVHVLRQNRCNDLFRLRAGDRKFKLPYDEIEFRICRTLSGYISGQLIAHGLAVASITVHAIGYIKLVKGEYFRDGSGFAVSLNGHRIAYEQPYPSNGSEKERWTYMQSMESFVRGEYVKAMRKNPALARLANNSLEALFDRLDMNLD